MAATVHQVLEAAHKALRIPLPADLGPKPMLDNATYVELAVWLADQVATKVPAKEQPRWKKLVELARPVRRVEQLSDAQETALAQLSEGAFDDTGNLVAGISPTMAVALLAADEAQACSAHNSCGVATRRAAVAATQILGETLLPALRRELERLDAVTLAAKQELHLSTPITETLWRGANGVKTTHWIVRLSDDAMALLTKQRGRWLAIGGNQEDVLASLPDEHMGAALAALTGGPRQVVTGPALRVIEVVGGAIRRLAWSADGERLYAEASKVIAWRADGEPIDRVPAEAQARLDVEPVEYDPKARTVVVAGVELTVDKPKITAVVVAGKHILVAYHGGMRVAIFDLQGQRRHVVDGRQLGEGIDQLYPMSSGLILAFSGFPRGTVLVLDAAAQALSTTRLGMYYARHKRVFADGKRAALAVAGGPTGNRLVIIG